MQQELANIQNYFAVQNVTGENWYFVVDFLLAGLCSFILALVYQKFGRSLSNRKAFAANFVLLTLTTMLIITVVKSSLALSLGLVGALSIVRFRSAIKEPEELAYIFLAMSLGLGFAADQRVITLLAFSGIVLYIIIRGFATKSTSYNPNMILSVSNSHKEPVDLDSITHAIKKYSDFISLKRLDQTDKGSEVLLYVKFKNTNALNKAMESINSLDDNLQVSFIEDRGLFT